MPPDYDAAVPPPSSRQEFVETLHRMIGDAGEDVGEPFLGIEVGELGGPNERVNQRPRSAPRSDQANNHDFLPSARPRKARSRGLLEKGKSHE
jgi:hypothetical protein